MDDDLRENLANVRTRIARAAVKVGRNPAEIKLIAVSKTRGIEVLEAAAAAGADVFGENKVQEADEKIVVLKNKSLEWHLIGHLQSNKARVAARIFDVIHTLDSVALAERLERICGEERRSQLKVLAQIDLAGETTKNGIKPTDLPALIEFTNGCEHLKLAGLMIIPPYFDDVELVRPFFRHLREMRDELLPHGELSMGMSHDFETAIEEGATLVRVGTAIFGEREKH